MTPVSPLSEPVTSTPALCLRRFTVDEYHRMIDLGILPEGTRVELLEGLLVLDEHAPPGPTVLVLPTPDSSTSPWPPVPVYQFSVDQYHRLIGTGILREGERVELLNGWVVTKMTRNPPHDLALSLAEFEIDRRLSSGWFRRGQSSVTTAGSEPEPDLAVVRGPRRRYANRHPGPADTALVMEVADSSVRHDQTVKAEIYARDGIPVCWIVNIPGRRVEVTTDPTGPGAKPCYRRRQDYGINDAVPLVLDGTHLGDIPVSDLLP